MIIFYIQNCNVFPNIKAILRWTIIHSNYQSLLGNAEKSMQLPQIPTTEELTFQTVEVLQILLILGIILQEGMIQ